MNRAAAAAPWLFAAFASALVIASVAGATAPVVQSVIVGVSCLAACVLGWRVNHMPIVLVAAVAIAGTQVAFLSGEDPFNPLDPGNVFTELVGIAAGVALMVILAIALESRRGRLDHRDLNDAVTAAVSAALATWVLFTSRLIDVSGVDPFVAITHTLYVPLAALLCWFVLDWTFTGLQANRAMRFVVAAAFLNLLGALSGSVRDTGLVGTSRAHEVALYSASFLMLCAGLVHRDAPAMIERDAHDDDHTAYTPLRLVLNGTSLLLLGTLVAVVPPTGELDTFVRTVAVTIGLSSVAIRLLVALRAQDASHQELESRVNLDDLTNLPTRARLVAVLSQVLEDTWRSEYEPTLIQLNLDRFKNINDSLGHYEANEVLVAVAERLTGAAESFGGTIARIGGDDFAVLDASTRSAEQAMDRVDVLREALAEPIQAGESRVFVTASFGVAMSPRNRTVTAEDLLRRADIATHRSKSAGRSGVSVFDDSMEAQLTNRMNLEHSLHGAIGRREMHLYHQPIVDVATGTVAGFESLIRWQREGDVVSPGQFIPIAEDTGMICELGEWALHEALGELRGWIEDDVVQPDTTISVNVSPRQIADPRFREIVRDALDQSGVPPQLLWLEITESMMLEEPELAERTLREVRELGVGIALDDFGTGYSSLSLLQRFPIQRIKIDRAFVTGIAEAGYDRSLVRTVIAMAESMDLDLVAEGVESIDQLRVLHELGCDKAQGFLISRPVPADAMRSTMVALDALAGLSLFGDADPEPAPVRSDPMPASVSATPGSGLIVGAAPGHRLGLPVV